MARAKTFLPAWNDGESNPTKRQIKSLLRRCGQLFSACICLAAGVFLVDGCHADREHLDVPRPARHTCKHYTQAMGCRTCIRRTNNSCKHEKLCTLPQLCSPSSICLSCRNWSELMYVCMCVIVPRFVCAVLVSPGSKMVCPRCGYLADPPGLPPSGARPSGPMCCSCGPSPPSFRES